MQMKTKKRLMDCMKQDVLVKLQPIYVDVWKESFCAEDARRRSKYVGSEACVSVHS